MVITEQIKNVLQEKIITPTNICMKYIIESRVIENKTSKLLYASYNSARAMYVFGHLRVPRKYGINKKYGWNLILKNTGKKFYVYLMAHKVAVKKVSLNYLDESETPVSILKYVN